MVSAPLVTNPMEWTLEVTFGFSVLWFRQLGELLSCHALRLISKRTVDAMQITIVESREISTKIVYM